MLSEAFITRSIQRGNVVKKYNIPELDIKGCIDCDKCFTDDLPCIIKDDFNQIANDLVEADVVVFSAPVYFYSLPGSMKNFVDRLNCFYVGEKNLSGKRYAIMSCCEENDMSSFDGLRIPIERSAKEFGWTLLDEVLAPSMGDAGDIEGTDGIQRAKDLADRV